MKQRKYLDFYGLVGRAAAPNPDFPHEVEDMLADMAYARVHGAAVIHNTAVDYSYEYGNKEVIKVANENKRLFGLAVVSSCCDYETGNKNYYNDLLDSGIRGFVILPNNRVHGLIEPKSLKKVVTPLIESGRPLIIPDAYLEDIFYKVDAIAESYPELNIIMKGGRWGSNRFLFDLMDNHRNISYEISQNHGNQVIEYTKDHFGIERVLFSSEWPLRSMGAIKTIVEYADISEEEKDLVAHGNACRLFGISPDDLELYDDKDCQLDELAREMDAGLPVSTTVIDAHTHVEEHELAYNNNNNFAADSDSMVKKMDALGIDTVLTSPFIGLFVDGIKANEEVLEICKKHPGRFLGYSCCNVNYEVERNAVNKYMADYPDVFVGMKPYPPGNRFDLTGELPREWFEYANEHHLPALIHAESKDATDAVEILSERYPNITFILAHSGASYGMARINAAAARRHDNVVVDITYTNTGRGIVELLVKEAGEDKVLYGSDMPMRDPAPQLGWVCYADLPVETKKKILCGNIKRIMDKRK